MDSARGFFLALEGGEGSGKSTQVTRLTAVLRSRGRTVVATREPGGTPAAEAIRSVLLSDALHACDPWTEALLFAACRADHVAALIRPALRRGHVVITDRFLDSSVAYQGVARGLGAENVRRANAVAVGEVVPDLTVVLDIAPGVGLGRAQAANRMEAESIEFHAQVRQAFLDFARDQPDRYLVVPADQDPETITEQILARIDGVAEGTREERSGERVG